MLGDNIPHFVTEEDKEHLCAISSLLGPLCQYGVPLQVVDTSSGAAASVGTSIPEGWNHLIFYTDGKVPADLRPKENLSIEGATFLIAFCFIENEFNEEQHDKDSDLSSIEEFHCSCCPTRVQISVHFGSIILFKNYDETSVFGAMQILLALSPTAVADYLVRKMGYKPKLCPLSALPESSPLDDLLEPLRLLQGEVFAVSPKEVRELIGYCAQAVVAQNPLQGEE
jgi:hypothetical protein